MLVQLDRANGNQTKCFNVLYSKLTYEPLLQVGSRISIHGDRLSDDQLSEVPRNTTIMANSLDQHEASTFTANLAIRQRSTTLPETPAADEDTISGSLNSLNEHLNEIFEAISCFGSAPDLDWRMVRWCFLRAQRALQKLSLYAQTHIAIGATQSHYERNQLQSSLPAINLAEFEQIYRTIHEAPVGFQRTATKMKKYLVLEALYRALLQAATVDEQFCVHAELALQIALGQKVVSNRCLCHLRLERLDALLPHDVRDVEDLRAWTKLMSTYAAGVSIILANLISQRLHGQSVELFETIIPGTCFINPREKSISRP